MHANVSSPTESPRGQGNRYQVIGWLSVLLEFFSSDFRPCRPGVSSRDYDRDTRLLLGQYSYGSLNPIGGINIVDLEGDRK